MTHSFQHTPGRTVIINKEEFLFFSGYDYLAMQSQQDFRELLKEGIDKYGIRFPSSRISNTQLDLFEKFENKLSKFTGSEATVCFASGFAAGKAATSLFDKIESAPSAHFCIKINESNFSTFDDWKNDFAQRADDIAFTADSVSVFDAEIYDFNFLLNKNIRGIIDASHAIGIVDNYENVMKGLLKTKNILFSYSLSKAFGLIGGAVSCSKEFESQLRNTNEYATSTSISPAMMYAFLNAEKIYEDQRKKLQQNILHFISLVKNILLIKFHPKLPVFILKEVDEAFLFQQKIIISSFAYPVSSENISRRIVINASHNFEDLEKLAFALTPFSK